MAHPYFDEKLERDPALRYHQLFSPASSGLGGVLLVGELFASLACSRDPDVVLRRLRWWHEEIERWSAGGARHPLTQSWPQPAQSVGEPVLGFARLAVAGSCETAEDLRAWADGAANALRPLLHALGLQQTDWSDYLLLELMLWLPNLTRVERAVWPAQLAARTGVVAGRVGDAASLDAQAALWEAVGPAGNRGPKPLLALRAGHLRRQLQARRAPGPLGQLWTAWRYRGPRSM